MLYERWREIAHQHRNEIALHDMASGERWTFAQFAAGTESESLSQPVIFPEGKALVFDLLRAWRSGRIVCPLEPGQTPPSLATLPMGCSLLKITSASTGTARVIAFTEEQLVADADNIVAT